MMTNRREFITASKELKPPRNGAVFVYGAIGLIRSWALAGVTRNCLLAVRTIRGIGAHGSHGTRPNFAPGGLRLSASTIQLLVGRGCPCPG